MGKLRIGIIGVGSIARIAHLPAYSNRDDVEVVAFADPETDRVGKVASDYAKDNGGLVPTVYGTPEEMFQQEKLDAVSICSPNVFHVKNAIEALKNDVHVLLEKPMSTSLEDANLLVERAKQSGKVLMVGMSHRYRQDVEVLKRFVDGGELGEIYYAKARILRRRGTPKGWFTNFELSGGGPLMDIGVHALDLTWWLMGKPEVASVSGYLKKGIGNDNLDFVGTWTASSAGNENNEIYTTEDLAAAFIRFQNGSVCQLEVSWSLNGPEDDALKVDIFGSKGGVSLDPLRLYSTTHNTLATTTPSVPMGNLYQREIDHFVHCIHNGVTPLSDGDQGRDVVRMLTAIIESSNAQKEVLF